MYMYMIFVYDTMFIMHSIIYSLYLLFCSISIQMYVQDLLELNVSRNNFLISSLFIN
jgi:hypothetical protein